MPDTPVPMTALRQRLLARQSIEELERKALKAQCLKSNLWTQEELDWAARLTENLTSWVWGGPHA